MNIYRNLDSGLLYTIEHLIYDIRFLNNNAFAGIYATIYPKRRDDIDSIKFLSNDIDKCKEFIEDNFELIATY